MRTPLGKIHSGVSRPAAKPAKGCGRTLLVPVVVVLALLVWWLLS
jgi:hypothetical protein